jgi:hypothetical protein
MSKELVAKCPHSSSTILDLGTRRKRVVGYRPGRFARGEKALSTHCIRGWVGPRADLDAMEKRKTLASARIEPRPPSR